MVGIVVAEPEIGNFENFESSRQSHRQTKKKKRMRQVVDDEEGDSVKSIAHLWEEGVADTVVVVEEVLVGIVAGNILSCL